MTGPHPQARELGMELADRQRSPLRYGFPGPAAEAGHELPPPVERWVPKGADDDLLRSALLAFEN